MKKIIATAVLGAMMALAGGYAQADAKNPKIGFSIDDLRLEPREPERPYDLTQHIVSNFAKSLTGDRDRV